MIYVVDLTIETAEPITREILIAVAAIGEHAVGREGERRLETTVSVDSETASSAIDRARGLLEVSGEIIAAEVVTEAEADRRFTEPRFTTAQPHA